MFAGVALDWLLKCCCCAKCFDSWRRQFRSQVSAAAGKPMDLRSSSQHICLVTKLYVTFVLWWSHTSHSLHDEAKLYVSSVLVDQRRITSWCRLPRETNNWWMWTPIKVLFVWKSWASRWCIRSTEKKYMLKEQTSASVPFLSSLFNKKCVSKFGCYLSLNATPSLRCQSRRSSHIPNNVLCF